jgi:hypothetical protein
VICVVLAERLDEVAIWLSRRRRRTACNAGRHPLGTADGLQRVKLVLDRRDSFHRGISFSDAPNTGQGRRRPAIDAAAVVFARRRSRIQLAIVDIDDASSGFLQFVVMALRGAQHSQLEHRHRDRVMDYGERRARARPLKDRMVRSVKMRILTGGARQQKGGMRAVSTGARPLWVRDSPDRLR